MEGGGFLLNTIFILCFLYYHNTLSLSFSSCSFLWVIALSVIFALGDWEILTGVWTSWKSPYHPVKQKFPRKQLLFSFFNWSPFLFTFTLHVRVVAYEFETPINLRCLKNEKLIGKSAFEWKTLFSRIHPFWYLLWMACLYKSSRANGIGSSVEQTPL